MRRGPNLSWAWVGLETLRSNPLRTVLSTLGIIIGVGALVSVLSLGDGMERHIRREIERTTSVQTVFVTANLTEVVDGMMVTRRDYLVPSPEMAREMAREIPEITDYSLSVQGSLVASVPRGRPQGATLVATLAREVDFREMEFLDGRYFSEAEAERGAPVVVLSHHLAARLAEPRDPATLVGETVRIGGSVRRVLGILAPYPGERSSAALVPLRAASALLPAPAGGHKPTLVLKARSVERVDELEARVEDWIATRFGRRGEGLDVDTQLERLEQAQEGILVFKLFLGAITGISLLVGGIGIMNVLLASVTERTREIGIRKAAGARRRDILLQFLAESVSISGAGSAIGVALGLAVSFLATTVMRRMVDQPIYPVLSASTLLLAVLSAVTVGLVFGIYPAVRASRLSPIEAIRHE